MPRPMLAGPCWRHAVGRARHARHRATHTRSRRTPSPRSGPQAYVSSKLAKPKSMILKRYTQLLLESWLAGCPRGDLLARPFGRAELTSAAADCPFACGGAGGCCGGGGRSGSCLGSGAVGWSAVGRTCATIIFSDSAIPTARSAGQGLRFMPGLSLSAASLCCVWPAIDQGRATEQQSHRKTCLPACRCATDVLGLVL